MHHYDKKFWLSSHEQTEGILNCKTQRRYPTTLTALVEAEHIDDLVGYTDLDLNDARVSSLPMLYQDRFEHLRDNNDYLELCWGGGYDSTNILKVSQKMGKPVDAITMYCRGDPWLDNTGANSELGANIGHVDSYLDQFPKTKINLLDIDKMWDIEKNKGRDYYTWCSAGGYGMLEDIARLSADDLIEERSNQQGTILTGKGYGGVVFNNKFNTWSYYSESMSINYPGAYSDNLHITRFYHDADIIRSTAESARAWYYRSDIEPEGDLWMTTEKWDHDAHTRYQNFDPPILHCGKSDTWQDNPKFTWLLDDVHNKNTYPEYWQFVEWLDSRLKPHMFEHPKGWFKNTLRTVLPPVIDF